MYVHTVGISSLYFQTVSITSIFAFRTGAPTSPWVCEELLPWHGGVTDVAGIQPIQLTTEEEFYLPEQTIICMLKK